MQSLPSLASFLVRLATLPLVGGGALLLVADSADCPDGYRASSYRGSFASTCPASIAAPRGDVAFDIHAESADGSSWGNDVVKSLKEAKINVEAVRDTRTSGDKTCSIAAIAFEGTADGVHFRCTDLAMDSDVSVVKCSAGTNVGPAEPSFADASALAPSLPCTITFTKKPS